MGYSHPLLAGDAVTLPLYFPSQLVRLFLSYYYYTAWLFCAIGPLPTLRGPGGRPLYPIRCTVGYLAYGRKLYWDLYYLVHYIYICELHLLHWRECSKNQASSTLILVRGPLKREHIQPDFRDNNPPIQHLQLIDFPASLAHIFLWSLSAYFAILVCGYFYICPRLFLYFLNA